MTKLLTGITFGSLAVSLAFGMAQLFVDPSPFIVLVLLFGWIGYLSFGGICLRVLFRIE